jgi:hypothetical protein
LSKQHWFVTGLLVLLCGGILVAFTDIEVRAVRWINCGPFSTHREDHSELCR